MSIAQSAFVVVLLSVSGCSFAQSSREYAVLGRTAWASFECSTLAGKMKSRAEAERLFNLGYESGKKFLDALQSKLVERKDLSEEVPIGFILLLAGPSSDFVLGRVFENAQNEALKGVLRSGDQLNPDDLQKMLAQSKFTKQNCQLLGAVK